MLRPISFITVLALLLSCTLAVANPLSEVTRLKKQALFSEAWESSEQGVKYWKQKISENLSFKAKLGDLYATRADLAAILGHEDGAILDEALKALILAPNLQAKSPLVIHPKAQAALKEAGKSLKADAESAMAKARSKEAQGAYCDAWTILTPYAGHVGNTHGAQAILDKSAIKCGNIRVPKLPFFEGDPGGSNLSFMFRKPNLVIVFPLMRKGADLPSFTEKLQTQHMVNDLKAKIPKAQVKQVAAGEMDRIISRLSTKDLRGFVKTHKLQISLGDLLSSGKVEVGELDSKMARDVKTIADDTGANIIVFAKFLTGSDPKKRARLSATLYHRDKPDTPLFMDTIKFGSFNMQKKLQTLEAGIARAANNSM